MAACAIFEEDEVVLETHTGRKWGLVLESSEYASSDEEEDNDGMWENVKKGTVRVAWHPDGEEEVILEKKLVLADRSLMPGDVVRRLIEGQDSQRGFVRNTQVVCHVQILDNRNKVLCNIDSTRLQPQRFWDVEPGDVFLDSWVGKIERVMETVILRFPDGAMCKIHDDDFYTTLSSFDDIHEKRNSESEFCMTGFYRGQKLRGQFEDLEGANWLTTTKQHSPEMAKKQGMRNVTVTVQQVETDEMEVHWLCRGYAKLDSNEGKMEPPPKKLDKEHIKRLRKLDCFESCSVQIGDKAFFTLSESDTVETYPSSKKHSLLHHIMLKDHPLPSNPSNGVDDIKEAAKSGAKIKSTAGGDDVKVLKDVQEVEECMDDTECQMNGVSEDVENDKGVQTMDDDLVDSADDDADDSDTCSTGSASSTGSNSSLKKKKSGLHTRLMKKSKLKRPKKLKKKLSDKKDHKPGDCLAVEIIYTLSKIEVVWQDGTIEKGIPSTELFPIHHLDELEFFPGDFVLPATTDGGPDDTYGVVQKVDHAGRTCFVKWLKPYHVGKSVRPAEIGSEEMSVYDVKDHMEYKFRPGHVVVRIGGYDSAPNNEPVTDTEEGMTCLEAAGQVYDLATDGSVLIRWASGRLATCYPQDLYLLGDELSDLGDSEFDSEEDSSSDENDSEASWETENEQELESDDSGSDAVELNAEDVDALSLSMAKCQSSLANLSDTIGGATVDIRPLALPIYKELLRLHRGCKDLDRTMATELVAENSTLKETMIAVRKEMMMEKSAKLATKVLHMFHDKHAEAGGDGDAKKAGDESTEAQKSNAAESEASGNSTDHKEATKPTPSLTDAEATLQENLLPPEEAKKLCLNACKALKEQLTKLYDHFVSKYQDKILYKPETEDDEEEEGEGGIELVAEGFTSPGVKNSEEGSKKIKEAKENMKLEICTTPAEEEIEAMLAKTPGTPQTPAEIRSKIEVNLQGFTMVESIPDCHRYSKADHQPNDPKSFFNALKKELKLLQSSLPKGIFVKGFEDRMDAFTAMVMGPAHTPYEDALFFFDVQLPADYPSAPPLFHYLSYCSDRLNPNLYEDGKVCVSLLGTWTGKGTEIWTSGKSSLLQVLISIQGLILVPEPYYNEAGYEKQRGSQQGHENSRMYNEMALVKVVQAQTRMMISPPQLYAEEVGKHMKANAERFIDRLEHWLTIAPSSAATPDTKTSPVAAATTPQACSSSVGGDLSSSSGSSAAAQPLEEPKAIEDPKQTSEDPKQNLEDPKQPLEEPKAIEDPKQTSEDPKQNLEDPKTIEDPKQTLEDPKQTLEDSTLTQKSTNPEDQDNTPDEAMDIPFLPKDFLYPQFPLLPVSKGFRLSLTKHLQQFHNTVKTFGYSSNPDC